MSNSFCVVISCVSTEFEHYIESILSFSEVELLKFEIVFKQSFLQLYVKSPQILIRRISPQGGQVLVTLFKLLRINRYRMVTLDVAMLFNIAAKNADGRK